MASINLFFKYSFIKHGHWYWLFTIFVSVLLSSPNAFVQEKLSIALDFAAPISSTMWHFGIENWLAIPIIIAIIYFSGRIKKLEEFKLKAPTQSKTANQDIKMRFQNTEHPASALLSNLSSEEAVILELLPDTTWDSALDIAANYPFLENTFANIDPDFSQGKLRYHLVNLNKLGLITMNSDEDACWISEEGLAFWFENTSEIMKISKVYEKFRN